MRRYYVVCKGCGYGRMRVIGKTWKTIRRPQAPTERYYQCPNCGERWSYDAERNTMQAGVPPEFTGPVRATPGAIAIREETEHFHQAVKIDAVRSETHFNLGVALVRQGYLAEAVQHFREALKIKPAFQKPTTFWARSWLRKVDLIKQSTYSSRPYKFSRILRRLIKTWSWPSTRKA